MKGTGTASLLGLGDWAVDDAAARQFHEEEDDGEGDPPRLVADTIAVNGKIVTLDDHDYSEDPGTIAEAMAIRDGTILDIGDTERVRRWSGPDTRTIDLDGKTVLPGIVESHVHPVNTMERLYGEELVAPGYHFGILVEETPSATVEKIEEVVERIKSEGLEEDEWVHGELHPNPDTSIDAQGKITSWVKTQDADDQQFRKEHLNEILSDNPFICGTGRSSSIAEPGEILRYRRTADGELEETVVQRGD